ncbi:hypothetical protein C8Q73DRAFT_409896 [Cubamyces lactineus]|nr:hypothetical protein C8Q73DRAFT_409896 [Cubamyces lactineus]
MIIVRAFVLACLSSDVLDLSARGPEVPCRCLATEAASEDYRLHAISSGTLHYASRTCSIEEGFDGYVTASCEYAMVTRLMTGRVVLRLPIGPLRAHLCDTPHPKVWPHSSLGDVGRSASPLEPRCDHDPRNGSCRGGPGLGREPGSCMWYACSHHACRNSLKRNE